MPRSAKAYVISAACLLMALAFTRLGLTEGDAELPTKGYAQDHHRCPSVNTLVRGHSLEPLLMAGAKIDLQDRNCLGRDLVAGDLVAFESAAHPGPAVIKRVAAVGGQVLGLAALPNVHNASGSTVVVTVDGAPALAPTGKPYVLKARAAALLAVYAGVLPQDTVLVLGNPGTLDSARLGPIHLDDIVGVVVSPTLVLKSAP